MRKILEIDFAAEWEKVVLHRIHHSKLDIDRLAERCLKSIENSTLELGESVFFEPKKGKSFPCKIIQGNLYTIRVSITSPLRYKVHVYKIVP